MLGSPGFPCHVFLHELLQLVSLRTTCHGGQSTLATPIDGDLAEARSLRNDDGCGGGVDVTNSEEMTMITEMSGHRQNSTNHNEHQPYQVTLTNSQYADNIEGERLLLWTNTLRYLDPSTSECVAPHPNNLRMFHRTHQAQLGTGRGLGSVELTGCAKNKKNTTTITVPTPMLIQSIRVIL